MLATLRKYEIVLGFLLGTVFWIGVLFWSSKYSETPQQSRATHATEQKSQKDLTDERLAGYTLLLAWFTGVLALSTVGLWIVTWRAGKNQSRDMQESLRLTTIAADAAKKSADASLVALRPWISCKVEIVGALTYTAPGDAQLELRFVVKNVGRSPAFGVRLIPSLNLLSPVHERSILRLQRIADHNRSMPVDASVVLIPGGIRIGGAELGLILFPGETSTFDYKIPISRGEIERSFEDIKPNKHFFPEVFGLVTYAYPLADVRADTGFVCGIENVTPDSKSGSAFDLGQSVRPEYMRVANHWGGFAT